MLAVQATTTALLAAEAGGLRAWLSMLPYLFCFFFSFALIGFFMWRAIRHLTPAARAEHRSKAEEWLEQKSATLAPWEPTSIGDISKDLRVRAVIFGAKRMFGQLRSASRDQNLIAFYTIIGLGDVQVYARTRVHRLHLDCQGKHVLNTQVENVAITVNGQPLGTWRQSDGTLLDAKGQPLGHVASVGTDRGDQKYVVTLGGTPVGEVLINRGGRSTGLLGFLNRSAQPEVSSMVIPTALTPPQEHERWLLAVALFRYAYLAANWATPSRDTSSHVSSSPGIGAYGHG